MLRKLSKHEKEILELLTQGYIYKEIAAIIFLSRRTVEAKMWKLKEDFEVKTLIELVVLAIKNNLIKNWEPDAEIDLELEKQKIQEDLHKEVDALTWLNKKKLTTLVDKRINKLFDNFKKQL